jgi:ornithine carbamoyltransferase (EC 2.1.3.3)
LEIEKRYGTPANTQSTEISMTPRAKRVLDLAYDEARQMGDTEVGSEHLLLGLIREAGGGAADLLTSMGVQLETARQAVRTLRTTPSQPRTRIPTLQMEVLRALRGRDLLSIGDLSSEECVALLELAAEMKRTHRAGNELLRWKRPHSLAMIFEKPSLRTRFTFEAAMVQLGGHAIYLSPSEIGLGKRESVADVARNLERWCQAIMARVYAHQTLMQLAENARVPVINALSDLDT